MSIDRGNIPVVYLGGRMRVAFVGSSSMGPRFIMGLLKKHGHECFGIYQGIDSLVGEGQADFFSKPISLEGLIALNPDIVGFSSCSFDNSQLVEMARKVKAAAPRTLTIFGGVQPTIRPDSVIADKSVDAICLGEGEYPMLDLCESLQRGESITTIQNLWVKESGTVHKNPLRPYVQNLDDLVMDREGIIYLGIYSGRGCAGRCTFCNTPTIRKLGAKGRYLRKRSVDNVLQEVEDVRAVLGKSHNLARLRKLLSRSPGRMSYFGVKLSDKIAYEISKKPILTDTLGFVWQRLSEKPPIRFKDDTFLSDKKWFVDFAGKFSKRFPDLGYICQARADEIDEEVVEAMAGSGCVLVSLGIECGNEEFRKKVIKKGVTNRQIVEASDLLKKYGIPIMGQWIIGYPTETPELAYESLMFHCRLGDIPQVHIASPLPATELHDMGVEGGFIEEGYSPVETLYGDFMFHSGYERKLMRVIYNLFPISRIPVPLDFKDLDFAVRSGRSDFKSGTKIGDVLGWDWTE